MALRYSITCNKRKITNRDRIFANHTSENIYVNINASELLR